MKEKQALYYRRKCEQFLSDIDKIVNAKVSQKGSQLIYNLDVASRELRVLKDNYRLMDSYIMDELHHQYRRAIEEQRCKISELRRDKAQQRDRMEEEIFADVKEAFKDFNTFAEVKASENQEI